MSKPVRDLEAFCGGCPAADEVTATLQTLGFRVTFQMDAVVPPESSGIPALPPQYHYVDDYGTEIVYLAGPDTPMEEENYPPHASRFWLWPGANVQAYTQAAFLLTGTYHVQWLIEKPDHSARQIA